MPKREPKKIPLEILPGLASVLDGAVILLAAISAYFIVSNQVGYEASGLFPVPKSLFALLVIVVFGVFMLGQTSKAYTLEALLAPVRTVRRLALQAAVFFAATWYLGSELLEGRARAQDWLDLYLALVVTGLVGARIALYFVIYMLAEAGRVRRKVAIFGAGPQAAMLLEHIALERPHINRIVGIFDDRLDRVPKEIARVPVRGTTQDLLRHARSNGLDEVIIALPWSADERIVSMIKQLRELPVKVRIASDLVTFKFPGQIVSDDLFRGLPMFDIVSKPLAGWAQVAKSLEDKILALVAILLLSPFLIAVAVAVRLESKGPVLFRQKRYGFNNQEFHVLKFRSMYHKDDPHAGTRQATKDDPRITRVGRFIRRTSLDELPQLFNVLGGSMSMVGPRPHSVQHNEQYAREIDGYFVRHKVKPGITGWAQVNGLRGETDTLEKMEYRVRYDVYYIENWSLLFDFEILVLTVFLGIVGKNAY